MPTLIEPIHTGEFLLSEGNGEVSREQVTFAQGTAAVLSGTVVGKITASGKYATYSNVAADGTQTAAGVLFNELPARESGGDVKVTIIARAAEVSAARLTGSDTAGVADLLALGVIVR